MHNAKFRVALLRIYNFIKITCINVGATFRRPSKFAVFSGVQRTPYFFNEK